MSINFYNKGLLYGLLNTFNIDNSLSLLDDLKRVKCNVKKQYDEHFKL